MAVGFGAQNLVRDFLSGMFMLLEDQYGVGDIVDLGEASGTVEAVGLRITTLRDVNGTVWYVRNGEILRVGNKSQGYAVAVIDIPVAHSADIAEATALAGTRSRPSGSRGRTSPPHVLGERRGARAWSASRPEGVTLRLTVKVAARPAVAVQRALNAASPTRSTTPTSRARACSPPSRPRARPSPSDATGDDGAVSDPQNFYAEVGGAPVFDKLVSRFYEEVAADEVLRPLYPEEDLGPAEVRLRMFLEQYWGGPRTYSDQRGHPRLRMRHNPFKVGPIERDAWLRCMRIAVDEAGFDDAHREQIWQYMTYAAASMQNSDF